ncbi:hypothetical protein [Microbulbifer sp. 2205BS26-8]|uniref:hypothetical protein n=1 Tax=Microbulbifer sp. 2205BS26-8 TaxID=3064386 RepID=UPI00273D98E0|nr:hypothetical protein [Microbulbifer sp. 2205BS26-8]MDP5211011.1 hypothetical protein [Microbulbifer sp. 2205BS26-8]
MESKLVVCNEIIVDPARSEVAWDAWKHQKYEVGTKKIKRVAYRCEDEPARFLELISIDDISELSEIIKLKDQLPDFFYSYLKSDWHQQVVELLDVVRPTGELLPTDKKLQLRYIEVPLSVFDEYREWRENTIYDVVKNSDSINGFLAYQSVFSTKPGVLFMSTFEGNTKDYMKQNFLTERYQGIVKEAGDRYIVGGKDGLFARVYARC